MKKLTRLFAFLFLMLAIASCSKEDTENISVGLKTARVDSYTTPISTNQIVPAILAVDRPRGGNVTCTDVEQAFGASFICGSKINYDDYDTEEEFEGAFPSWLNVKVDGIYISFNIDGCGEIDGKNVKVGAVIVKGSNAASVYYYEDGTLSDSHLAAPGDKYMVSNLTFCFVECEKEDLIIAVKVWYYDGPSLVWGASTGTFLFSEAGWWCKYGYLGVNSYPGTPQISLEQALSDNVIGGVTITGGVVEISLNEGLILDKAYIFIGTQEELMDPNNFIDGCPNYTAAPWVPYIEPNE